MKTLSILLKMKIYTTVYDVMATIRGNFCLGGRGFNTPLVDQVPNNGIITVWIMVGIPGTGKTTISEMMKNAYPPYRCKVISRDETRTDILIDLERLPEDERKIRLKAMDTLTTRGVMERVRFFLDDPGRLCSLIIDGCHTHWLTLLEMIDCVARYGNKVLINLLILGDPESTCCHAVSPKEEGDYSDYGPHGTHQNIPIVVLERKRKEMADLLTNHMEQIIPKVDEIYCILDCFDRKKKAKYK